MSPYTLTSLRIQIHFIQQQTTNIHVEYPVTLRFQPVQSNTHAQFFFNGFEYFCLANTIESAEKSSNFTNWIFDKLKLFDWMSASLSDTCGRHLFESDSSWIFSIFFWFWTRLSRQIFDNDLVVIVDLNSFIFTEFERVSIDFDFWDPLIKVCISIFLFKMVLERAFLGSATAFF